MISIIIPVYNEIKFINNLLNFCLSAKPCEKEIILIDGGSKDGTIDIIKKYAEKYANVIFHKRKKNISTDKSTDFQVFNDFVNKFNGTLPRFFVHLRPTTPFRDSKIIDKIINQFIKKEKKYSSLRSVSLMINPVNKSVIIKASSL